MPAGALPEGTPYAINRHAGADQAVLGLKSLEAFTKAADGKSDQDHYSVADAGAGRSCDNLQRGYYGRSRRRNRK